MVTPDKPGGTPPKYSEAEKSRVRSAGYKLLKDKMKSDYESPGLGGHAFTDRLETEYTSDKVPRRKD